MLSCEFLDVVLVVVAGSELSVVIGVVVVVITNVPLGSMTLSAAELSSVAVTGA